MSPLPQGVVRLIEPRYPPHDFGSLTNHRTNIRRPPWRQFSPYSP